mgnify:FL=1
MIEHEARISVLETKLDALTETMERIEQKLDSISRKQMDFEVNYRVFHMVGRILIAIIVTLGGWLSWDTISSLLHSLTAPRH